MGWPPRLAPGWPPAGPRLAGAVLLSASRRAITWRAGGPSTGQTELSGSWTSSVSYWWVETASCPSNGIQRLLNARWLSGLGWLQPSLTRSVTGWSRCPLIDVLVGFSQEPVGDDSP